MILNKGQDFIVREALKSINSSDNLFQFSGEAGTGKSVVLNAIAQESGYKLEEILFIAFTGQAAIVMRTKGMTSATTCHSALFEFQEKEKIDKLTGRVMIDTRYNIPITEMIYTPKSLSTSGIKLILIDEAPMVPQYIKDVIDDSGIMTIAAGDIYQLPPVGSRPTYLSFGKVYFLTELMRQAQNSAIVWLAHRSKAGLPIFPGMYGNEVLVIYEDELTNDLLFRADIVLSYRNKTRNYINDKFRREFIKTDKPYPMYGERMICKKNNWEESINGISLANGLTGTVIKPPSIHNFNEKTFGMDFLPDLMNVPFTDLICDYEYLKADQAGKDLLKKSRFSIGEKFDWGYAGTVHTAQGSEYSKGIYIEEPCMDYKYQSNLNYTAITRFRNKLIYVIRRPKNYYNGI